LKKKFKKNKLSGQGKFGENTSEFLAAVDKAQTFKKVSDPAFLPEDSIP